MAGWRLDDVITTEQILKMVSEQRELNFEPGAEHVYCNTGYTLMAETVSRVTGTAFPEWMTEKVFKPLGMSHTHFHDDHQRIVPNRAYSYQRDQDEQLKNSILSYANVGATSLFTTAEDLVRWIENLRSGTIGGREITERLLTRGVLNDGTEIDYAFGISHADHRGLHGIGHSGGDAGFRTWLQYFPEQDFGVVVLSNLASFAPNVVASKITEIFLGEFMEDESGEQSQPQPHALTRDALQRFVGRYQVLDTPVVWTVSLEGGQLHVSSTGLAPAVLTPVSNTGFVMGASGNRVDFESDDDGCVSGFTATLDGQEFRGVPLDDVPVAELGQYVGRYYSPELLTFYSIRLRDDALRAVHQRHTDVALTPLGEDQFGGDQWWFGRATFSRDQAGQIEGFRLTGGGVRNLRFERVVE